MNVRTSQDVHTLFSGWVQGLIALLTFCLSLSSAWGETITISESTTILAQDDSYDGSDLIIDGATLTIQGEHNFNSLSLINSSVIKHQQGASDKLVLNVVAEFSISSNSSINLNGLGLGYTEDAGYQTGGSHGGRGGFFIDDVSTSEIGSFAQPASFGMGGRGTEGTNNTSYGGGAVKIKAGTLTLNGRIFANGNYTGSYIGGGSGGSVWLDVGTLSGSGFVYAQGSRAQAYGSGGGGGRIAVYFDANDGFDLSNLSTQGGSGQHAGSKHGGVGSIYVVDRSQNTKQLLYRGASSSTTYQATTIDAAGDITELKIQSAHVEFPKGQILGAIIVNTDHSRIALTPELEVQGATLNLHNRSVLSYTDLDTVESPKHWKFLSLTENSSIQSPRAKNASSHTLSISADDITIDSTSSINLNGLGLGYTEDAGYQTGGSHGGRGGFFIDDVSTSEIGSFAQPTSFGLGGRGREGDSKTNYGGGAVKIVAGRLTLDGQILANGVSTNTYIGGGSGGSIWLDVGTLSGVGRVYAQGGSARSYGSGGGGGRIAVYFDENDGFDLSKLYALGGSGVHTGSKHGGVGSIYLADRGNNTKQLLYRGSSSSTSYQSTSIDAAGDITEIAIQSAHVEFPKGQILGAIIVNTDHSRIALTPELEVQGATLNLHNRSVLSYTDLDTVESPKHWKFLSLTENSSIQSPRAKNASSHTLSISADDITIDSSSRIDVSGLGLGYAEDAGYQTGGSHGGRGGFFNSNNSVSESGNFAQPTSFGLGGRGRESDSKTNYGGGAVKIVAGRLTLDGQILANGVSSNTYIGGGSGGSIWLDVGTLSGVGRVYAQGGSARSYGSGGGGGRIAVYFDENNGFDLSKLYALGGSGVHTGSKHGGVGSIYLADRGNNTKQLLYRGSSSSTSYQSTSIDAEGDFSELIINTALTAFPSNQRINLKVIQLIDSHVTLPSEAQVQSSDLILDSGSILNVSNLTNSQQQQYWNSVDLKGNSKITHGVPVSSNTKGIDWSIDSLIVSTGSSIDASAAGLPFVQGTGKQAGGSFGGKGGHFTVAEPSLPAFGEEARPDSFGLGGRDRDSDGSLGGGQLKLVVNDLTLDGSLKANGQYPSSSYIGGGSGGSVWVIAKNINGSGFIQAHGGNARGYGGGGSGGRVALYYQNNSGFNLDKITTAGGTGVHGATSGEDGTVFINQAQEAVRIVGSRPYNGELLLAPITFIDVGFHGAIDSASFGLEDIRLNASSGPIMFDSIEDLGNNEYRLHLKAPLSNADTYRLEIGPDVLTTSGVPMDQDGDTTPGEASDDVYRVTFDLENADEVIDSDITIDTSDPSYKDKILLVQDAVVTVTGDYQFKEMRLTGDAVLTSAPAIDASTPVKTLTFDRLTVDSSAMVDVTGLGLPPTDSVVGLAGGSYGGLGTVDASDSTAQTNPTFGSEHNPADYGIGGRSNSVDKYSVGGGALKLVVEKLQLEGAILANGGQAQSDTSGASGGSLWIEANTVSGSGVITANGSTGNNLTAHGGGGRVALYYQSLDQFDLASQIQAKGGNQTAETEGTVYSSRIEVPTAVKALNISEYTNQELNELTVEFINAIKPESFDLSDVALVDENSSEIQIVEITQVNPVLFKLHLPYVLPEGEYSLSIGPEIEAVSGDSMDQNGNGVSGEAEDVFKFTFNVDSTAPLATSIDSHTANQTIYIADTKVTLSGVRSEDSSIWINDREVIAHGSASWTLSDFALIEGTNQLEIVTRDLAGNASEAITLTLVSDVKAPKVLSVVPSNHSNTPTSQVTISFEELHLDESALELVLKRFGIAVNGSTSIDSAKAEIYFESGTELTEGEYQLELSLVDLAGNTLSAEAYTFVLDFTKPSSLTVNAHPSSVNTPYFAFEGNGLSANEPSLWINGIQALSQEQNAWSHQVSLVPGVNVFKFQSQDLAGNLSDEVIATITFDDTAPGVPVLTITNQGNGSQVGLSWEDYDVVANGDDIVSYQVYQSSAAFTEKASAQHIANLPATVKTYTVNGLTRGENYYFAVAPVDSTGNSPSTLVSYVATPTDTVAPAAISGIQITSEADSVTVAWSANTDEDLSHYRIYQDGQLLQDNVAPTTLSHTFTGWSQAESHLVSLSAVDTSENESIKTSNTLVTWLANPAGISTEAQSGKVDLSWNNTQPSLTSRQLIFVSDTNFTDVTGMQPKLRVSKSASQVGVAGLTNDQDYYFAVVSENINGGFNPSVTTVMATPEADTSGPVINGVSFGGLVISDLSVLSELSNFTVSASDPSGISHVEFYIDGQLVGTSYNGNSGFSQHWDLLSVADGQYQLKIKVFDTVDNVTEETLTLNVQLSAPAAPSLVAPIKTVTNKVEYSLTVNVLNNTQIMAVVNGEEQGDWLDVASSQMQLPVTLSEGENTIQAKVRFQGRHTESTLSNTVVVSLDTSLPERPTTLNALSKVDGRIALSWNKPNDEHVKGFNIYRSTQEIDQSLAGAEKINAELYLFTSYEDTLEIDGDYYYRVVAVNDAETESLPSDQASAVADSLGPIANLVGYVPQGQYDEVNNIFGRGMVEVSIRFNEVLRNDPFFAMTPEGGTPTSIELNKDYNDDLLYTGTFEITEAMLTGKVWAVLSAHDEIGNRGSDITEGQYITVDSQGPEVINLAINPTSPIDNEGTPELTVVLDTNDFVAEGSIPVLVPEVSSPNGYLTVAGLDDGISLSLVNNSAHGQTWQGQFTLPADVGLDENGQPNVESLRFNYQAADALGNESTRIRASNYFQVYQGDLPPLATPTQLYAKALPNAQVELSWQPVEYAAAYLIYRKAENEFEFTQVARTEAPDTTGNQTITWIDGIENPLNEGLYEYSVASVRLHDGEESVSARSESVSVIADATAPSAPTNLVLTLAGNGIAAQWIAPTGETQTGQLRYELYRLAIGQGDAVDLTGVEPIQTGLRSTETLDPSPSEDAHTYVVVAKDAAGNASLPSSAVYLNFDLLPVTELEIEMVEANAPVIRWQHSGSTIEGFNVFKGVEGSEQPLNTSLITDTSWQDETYPVLPESGAPSETTYSVIAKDSNGAESAAHYLTLPALSANLSDSNELTSDGQLLLKRGVMNRVIYRVDNQGSTEAKSIRLFVTIDGEQTSWVHQSEYVDVPAQGFAEVPVVIGGYAELQTAVELTSRIEQSPFPGEKIRIIQKQHALVAEDAFLIELKTKDFTKGGTGQVKFSIRNHTDVEVELLTAQNNGKDASSEARFVIEDLEGNILLKQPLHMVVGNVINTANGYTVVRVPASETYESEWIELPVSVSSLDQVRVRFEVDQFRYHSGQIDAVAIAGTQATTLASMGETAYYATLSVGKYVDEDTSVTPIDNTTLFPGDIIELSGQAISRETSQTIPFVPVKLLFRVRGFDKEIEVTTDAEGNFSFLYPLSKQRTGTHTLAALHPSILERPDMVSFTVMGLDLKPGTMNVHLPYNYPGQVPFEIQAGKDTELGNVHFEIYFEEGQTLPEGLQVTLPQPLNVTSEQKAVMTVGLAATNAVAEQGQVLMMVHADESSTPIGYITLNYKFSEAAPSLVADKQYLETGTSRGVSISETVTLKNQGLSDISDLVLTLETPDKQAAPSWLYVASDRAPGQLKVGESLNVDLVFNPSNSVAEAIHEFRLVASSETNNLRFEHPVYVAVTQSGTGSMAFHVADIYTATLDENNQPIPGLAGAKIKLQNELVLNEVYEATTNEYGEALFEEIPAGRYIYRAMAFDHNSATNRIWVRAGVTSSESIFLANQLVTVEFSVKEIVLEDRYEINIEPTFETKVPAPVVVVEPMSVNLPVMKKGEVYQGELTYTNHGLIRAIDVNEDLPKGDNFARFEFLSEVPDSIEPGEVVVVPYRIQALQDFDQTSLEIGSGGATCGPRDYDGKVSYKGECPSGFSISGSAATAWAASVDDPKCRGISGGDGIPNPIGRGGDGDNSISGGNSKSFRILGGGCSSDDDDDDDDDKDDCN
ncbi:Ig-like domain-containing protein [Litoribrevibacter euphylliae]|uniref:Ig-like domain-containing protein n=1 Tax=Litoribrevibacter euphylliae TaxID=1834034 RepID=A0ABV7HAL8_9GAMM